MTAKKPQPAPKDREKPSAPPPPPRNTSPRERGRRPPVAILCGSFALLAASLVAAALGV